jgi:hypothetical protein
MKNRKKHILTSLLAVMLCMAAFPLTAYAGGGPGEPEEPAPVIEETPPPEKPFTPAGTGTVVDNATDADDKEFFTIMTPNENVFYLVIDRQRETENVYFLNAVTEKDLLALAEQSEDEAENVSAIPEPPAPTEPEPEPEPTPEAEPEPETGGNSGMAILLIVLALGGGGAGWYFKIYRPKQQQADAGAELDDYEADPYGEETEDNALAWDVEDESGGDGDR